MAATDAARLASAAAFAAAQELGLGTAVAWVCPCLLLLLHVRMAKEWSRGGGERV